MVTIPLRSPVYTLGISNLRDEVSTVKQSLSPTIISLDDPFHILSASLPFRDAAAKFWWHTTGAVFAQMMKRAYYPIHYQYRFLLFYYLTVLPEFGPSPSKVARTPITNNTCLPTPSLISSGAEFKSYMTDDHSPMELSWRFGNEGGAVVRFAIDPVKRQVEGHPRGAMGIFDDLGRSNFVTDGFNLDWCRVCASSLTLPAALCARVSGKRIPKYPSQYFVGFDFSAVGIVIKAYFLPETRAAITSTPESTLITSCITALSTPTPNLPDPPDLLTPWERVLSFFNSLPSTLAPHLSILAVDCVPAHHNRVKVYARTPRSTLVNLRRFFTLGRDPSCTSPATQRALKQATILWHLICPTLSSPDFEDVEPQCPQHATGGLLWYYELLPGHAEPFPKVYLPVRHWCSSDEHVVQVMEAFYTKIGNFKAAERYARDIRETYTHRQLSARAGIHTYITIAVKPTDVEVTSYFNPECYAPERGCR